MLGGRDLRDERVWIGERIRSLRESRQLSQGDIEQRSGLLRSYLSRVENGHTVPSLETLERLARALEVPLYQLFVERPAQELEEELFSNADRKERRYLLRMVHLLRQMPPSDRDLLLDLAKQMARTAASRNRRSGAHRRASG
jgi:transcriptional regulator with XRE-family HTH domain